MKIQKLEKITIISTEGLLPPVEKLCGNVLIALGDEDRAELERIAREGIAPLMAMGFSQAMAQRIRKAMGIRSYTGESLSTRWRREGGRKVLDELYEKGKNDL